MSATKRCARALAARVRGALILTVEFSRSRVTADKRTVPHHALTDSAGLVICRPPTVSGCPLSVLKGHSLGGTDRSFWTTGVSPSAAIEGPFLADQQTFPMAARSACSGSWIVAIRCQGMPVRVRRALQCQNQPTLKRMLSATA
jgi:hypothetical protein